jgi:hypothetical protein
MTLASVTRPTPAMARKSSTKHPFIGYEIAPSLRERITGTVSFSHGTTFHLINTRRPTAVRTEAKRATKRLVLRFGK